MRGKLFLPVFGPLLVNVARTALQRNSGGKENDRSRSREGLDERIGDRIGQMFTHLQTHRQIESAVKLYGLLKIDSMKVCLRKRELLNIYIITIVSCHIFNTLLQKRFEPQPPPTAYIYHAFRTYKPRNERRHNPRRDKIRFVHFIKKRLTV